MGKHLAPATGPTQVTHPWRATARTVFQAVVMLAAGAPFIYQAITEQDPGSAAGGAGVALAVAGAITRVMALPLVEDFLAKYIPFLAAAPADA